MLITFRQAQCDTYTNFGATNRFTHQVQPQLGNGHYA